MGRKESGHLGEGERGGALLIGIVEEAKRRILSRNYDGDQLGYDDKLTGRRSDSIR
jgi:hypothetical protein